MPSETETLALHLVRAVYNATDGRPMQWRMGQTIAQAVGQDEATADAAIAYAIERDWLIGGGNPPHSICLTDDGRILSATLLKRAR